MWNFFLDLGEAADVIQVGVGHDHPLDMGQVDAQFLNRLDLVGSLSHKPGIYEAKVSGRRPAKHVYMGIGYHLILTLDKKNALCSLLHLFSLGYPIAEPSMGAGVQVFKFFQNRP